MTRQDSPEYRVPSLPSKSTKLDWLIVVLGGWLIVGMALVGRAVNQGSDLDSLFTPWNFFFLAGLMANAVFAYGLLVRSRLKSHRLGGAPPAGYELHAVGMTIIVVGGLAGLVWLLFFGINAEIRSLPSPIHLVLALGLVLTIVAPIRSGIGPTQGVSTRRLMALRLPAILSLSFALSVVTLFTQFAHPLVEPLATIEISGVRVFDEIHVMSADGADQMRLTISPESADWAPSWSPDGNRIAFVSKRHGLSEIFTSDADGTRPRRLTVNEDRDWDPGWSPNGERLVFSSDRDGDFQIYVMGADGTGLSQLTRSDGDDLEPSWSPDGKRIAFASERDGNFEVSLMNADGSGQVKLTRSSGGDRSPSWSPDGEKIAFESQRDGNSEIYVMNADGTSQLNLTNNESLDKQPSWSPDGNKIAFVSERDGNFEVYSMNRDGTEPVNLTNDPGAEDDLPSWSPDSEKIVYTSAGRARHSTEGLGVASVALQAGLLIGAALLAIRWLNLPTGSLSILFTINAVIMSTQEDTYYLVPGVIAAGLLADVLLWRVRRSVGRVRPIRVFAISVPAIYYAFYFLSISLTQGIGWPMELWSGSIFLAGLVGLLLSYMVYPPGQAVGDNGS